MSTIIKQRQYPGYRKFEMDLAGRPLTLEVGKLAELANAAVMVGYGDTRVLCCVTAAPRPRDGIDFFPMSVDFEEKMYAVGRIPGSFNRREGRPGEKGILTGRVIDRPIRPLFPYDFRNDVSIMATVMAVDHDCSPEIAALIGTSAALAISDIPWNGPVGAVKMGLVDGKLIVNPDAEMRKVSDLDVTVVSTGKKVVMIEAGANEVPNDVMLAAIKTAHEENQKQIALINQMVEEIGKPKFEYPHADFDQVLFDKIVADFMDEAKAAMVAQTLKDLTAPIAAPDAPSIFVSYSSRNTDIALRMRNALNQCGLQCWMAPDSIPSGSSYQEAIPLALSRTSAVALLLTPEAVASRWVSKEIGVAIGKGQHILPYQPEPFDLNDTFSFLLDGEQIYPAWHYPEHRRMPELSDRMLRLINR